MLLGQTRRMEVCDCLCCPSQQQAEVPEMGTVASWHCTTGHQGHKDTKPPSEQVPSEQKHELSPPEGIKPEQRDKGEVPGDAHLGMELVKRHDGPEEEEGEVEVVLEEVEDGVDALLPLAALEREAHAAHDGEAAASVEEDILKIKSSRYKPALDEKRRVTTKERGATAVLPRLAEDIRALITTNYPLAPAGSDTCHRQEKASAPLPLPPASQGGGRW